ncbi:MAG: mechanosensitive ion channel family protein [Cellulomonas sp.]|jgi:small conductance mechanosensitive channel|nr:mechanosensitive ion channel family protein [Cellulomonas sp.]
MTPTPTPTLPPVVAEATDDPHTWWDWFFGVPLRICLYIVVGLLVLVALRRLITWVTNRLAREPTLSSDLMAAINRVNPLSTARRAQRARTVGSVLRSVASLLIGTIVGLLVLDALGVSLAPFIASAGIVGIALGFGAQTLVKDFLAGLFMLVEDQYGVGDIIDVGVASGTVEAVGLRVTEIRDADGTLWFVPNGSVTRVANKTQQWATAVLDVDVDYFADIDQVRDLLTAAATAVVTDPDIAPDVHSEPLVTGIEQLTALAVTLRVQVRTSPARQWEVARRLRVAVRDALTAADIPLAGQRDLWELAHAPAEHGRPVGQDEPTRPSDQPEEPRPAAQS